MKRIYADLSVTQSQHAAGGQNSTPDHTMAGTLTSLFSDGPFPFDVPAGCEFSNLSLSMFRISHLDKTQGHVSPA